MATRQIVFSDDPLLRKTSSRVRDLDADTQELIDDMIETMHVADGIGLAAIQVGEKERIIVVEVPITQAPEESEGDEVSPDYLENLETERYVVINPKLIHTSRKMEEGIEGCLSIPGVVGMVERHRAVTVKGLDRHGHDLRIEAEGLLARVLQHEIDHCRGVLFIDRIQDPEKIWLVQEGEEEAIEAAQEIPAEAKVAVLS